MRLESGGKGSEGRKGRNGRLRLLPLLPLLPFLPLLPVPASAQELVPPQEQAGGSQSGLRLGILGFASRVGVDFSGANQVILSPTLDVADLWTPRIRVRPSAEIGLGDTAATYVMNLELLFRFTVDQEGAVPYLGFGGAVMSQDRCAAATDCPRLWAQFALGFELKFREHMNWMVEYHGEDSLRRHRFFIGLTTRRGS